MEKFIENFKNLLEVWPDEILEDRKKEALRILEEEQGSEGFKSRAIGLAKTAYPYIYAYFKVYDECCRVKEEVGIHNFLKDETSKARFNKFLEDGGDIEKMRQGNIREIYLTEEDVEAFKKAEAEVHDDAHKEVKDIIASQDRARFDSFVEKGKEKMALVEAKLSNLKNMALQSEEWGADILKKIEEFNERWVNFTNEPSEEDLDETLEYFSSAIGTSEV